MRIQNRGIRYICHNFEEVYKMIAFDGHAKRVANIIKAHTALTFAPISKQI
jgi:hypothetical protein